MSKDLLIIFVKNLVPGHVKTRLAAEIGIDGALDVYQYLVEYTCEMAEELDMNKAIYYSEYVEIEDIRDTEQYQLFVQKGDELGERMDHAFEKAFEQAYDKVVLIGSDCFEITQKHIEQAFKSLDENDLVIGPAKDGGYYLIGMKESHSELFENKKYGHENVLKELLECIPKGKTFDVLEKLSDIDTFQDLKDSPIDFQFVDPNDEENN